MWSAVAICFAAISGWNSETWTVQNTFSRRVAASSPQAQLIDSNVELLIWASPAYPFQRAIGIIASIPSSSASCANLRLFSQLATHGFGIVAYVRPLERSEERRVGKEWRAR